MSQEELTKEKSDASKIQVGDVFSRHSFGTVIEINHDSITVKNTEGRSWLVGKSIVEDEFQFAEHASQDSIPITRTDLIKLMLTMPRVAMTLVYNKKIDHLLVAKALSKGKGEMTDRQWSKLVKQSVTGEERTMKGFHTASYDEHSRLYFTEIGNKKGSGLRLVDTRTLTEVIMCNKHFVVK